MCLKQEPLETSTSEEEGERAIGEAEDDNPEVKYQKFNFIPILNVFL